MSALRRIGLVSALFLVAGAAAGVLWEWLWDPTTGVTYQGQWYLEPAGPDQSFSSIALFVVIAVPLGIVLGVLSGIWRDQEVVTTVTVLVAAVGAGLLMYAVGHALGPPDPQVLAAAKPDYTTLPGDLVLTAPDADRVAWHSSALVALPAGAMAGLVATYLLGKQGLTRRSRG
ncbi:hypothetical protein EUA93_15305 [Nocardioides oleivorans]|uniref:DUF2567 domain-containing protein n=1 Tax=Nocardioides oleivorans TaxID=273676 RepID=A0A4Q2S4Y4_9ACTN|nr:hypothetical protein [Nocardioides oleivorans]RYB95584.1 hypothetical protein EUA93_15305 [Nocardioides oleivorans]